MTQYDQWRIPSIFKPRIEEFAQQVAATYKRSSRADFYTHRNGKAAEEAVATIYFSVKNIKDISEPRYDIQPSGSKNFDPDLTCSKYCYHVKSFSADTMRREKLAKPVFYFKKRDLLSQGEALNHKIVFCLIDYNKGIVTILKEQLLNETKFKDNPKDATSKIVELDVDVSGLI